MKTELLKKLELQAKKELEHYKFHIDNGDKYNLATFFNGKRAAIRGIKKIIKNLTIPVVGVTLPSKEEVSLELERHQDKWAKNHTKEVNYTYSLGFRYCYHFICDRIKGIR